MNFPQSLSQIFLLCGTNNPASTSPAVLSATVIEILSAIANNCPTTFIHFYPILPHFDHCYSFVQVTSSHFFQVQECFSEKVFLRSTIFPMYRDDKIHLTNKGNDILVRWVNYYINCNTKPHLFPSLHPATGNFSAIAKPTPLQANSPCSLPKTGSGRENYLTSDWSKGKLTRS